MTMPAPPACCMPIAEPRTENPEPRTKNQEPATLIPEPRTRYTFSNAFCAGICHLRPEREFRRRERAVSLAADGDSLRAPRDAGGARHCAARGCAPAPRSPRFGVAG